MTSALRALISSTNYVDRSSAFFAYLLRFVFNTLFSCLGYLSIRFLRV